MAIIKFNHKYENFYVVPCRDNKEHVAMTEHKKIGKLSELPDYLLIV